MDVPSLHRIELVAPRLPGLALRPADRDGDLALLQVVVEIRVVGMSHVVRILDEPMWPFVVWAVEVVLLGPNDDDFWRVLERPFETLNVRVDLRFLKNVAVDF